MNKDTILLLKECDAGCKMATNSMEQIRGFELKSELKDLIDRYNKAHQKLGEKCTKRLEEAGEEKKDPSMPARAMSYLSTEIKLMLKEDAQQAAKILTDGCNMGIQTLVKKMNEYEDADEQSKNLTKKIIALEEEFMQDLRKFL